VPAFENAGRVSVIVKGGSAKSFMTMASKELSRQSYCWCFEFVLLIVRKPGSTHMDITNSKVAFVAKWVLFISPHTIEGPWILLPTLYGRDKPSRVYIWPSLEWRGRGCAAHFPIRGTAGA
jgi:hypothetical protein